MAKASKELIEELEATANAAADGLPRMTVKKMFGCHALFANGNVFGLVWKEGRIGVRLPDETSFKKLMDQKGSAPWKAGKMTMSHWVLVPEGMHKDGATLRSWFKQGHAMALAAEPKAAKSKAAPKKK